MFSTFKVINDYTFFYPNEKEFLQTYEDIYEIQEYDVYCQKSDPFIIDCGSHMGLSLGWWKKKFPHSKIFAFEPNPYTLPYLYKNIESNDWENVTVFPYGIGDNNGLLDFYVNSDPHLDWTINTSFVRGGGSFGEQRQSVKVPVVGLNHYLSSWVDILKLDVQGMETMVLQSIVSNLHNVEEIILEYHGKASDPFNNLSTVVDILQNEGFSMDIKQEGRQILLQDAIDKDLHWIIVRGWR